MNARTSQSANGSETGTYRLMADTDDYLTSVSHSGFVTVGGSATGTIERGWDRGYAEDWFRVTLTAGVQYTVDLRGAASGR